MSNTSPQIQLSDEQIAEITFKIIIYIAGVVGNLLVVFVILFLQEYKKITHWYVLQMALADIVFLQSLPFKLREDIYGGWSHADWLCSAQQTVLYLTYYASIMFLVIMAVDRYLAVCHSMSSFVQRVRQPNIAYITALITWIVAILLSIPVMMNSRPFGLKPNCKCRFQFPVDEHAYCVKSGLGLNEIMMEDCLVNVYPHVVVGECVDLRSPLSSIPNPALFGNTIPLAVSNVNTTGLDSASKTNTTAYTTAATFPVVDLPPPVDVNQTTGINTVISQPSTNLGIGILGIGDPFAEIDVSLLGINVPGVHVPSLPKPAGNSSALTNTTSNTTTTKIVAPPPPPSVPSGQQIITTACHYDETRTGWFIFTIVNSVVMFLVPLLIISVCYGLIIRRLVASSVSSGSGKGSTGKSDREKRKVTILCALLTTLFTIFWLPFHSVQLAKLAGIQSSDEDFCVRLVNSTSLLVYLNSATNPYLYNFLGTFKKRMKQIRDSKRMQSILSAAGITRSTRTSKGASSSDGTKDKSAAKNSAIPMSTITA